MDETPSSFVWMRQLVRLLLQLATALISISLSTMNTNNMDDYQDLSMKMDVEDLDKYCPRNLDLSTISEAEFQVAAFNDSCLENFFYQLHASLRRFSQWEEILYTCVYVIISAAAVIGNGLVILAVVRKKSMQTNRNVLILNLAISNLLLAFINIPFLWLPTIDFEFPYSRFFCKFANGFPGSNIYCSTLTICVMAVDRYYSVKRMKAPANRRQCMGTVLMSLGIWGVSFILSVPLLVYYDTSMLYVVKDVNVFDEHGNSKLRSYGWRQCRLAPSRTNIDLFSTQTIQLVTSLLQVIFLYIVPLFVLSIFNMKLTRFLRMNSNQVNRNRTVIKKEVRPAEVTSNLITTRNASMIAKPATENNADRRTSRTTSLLFAMAGSYAALWFPFTLVSLLLDLDILYHENYAGVIERVDQLCKIVSMLSICVNPFLYGYLNTNFRHEFAEIYYTYVRCQVMPQANRRGLDLPSIVVNVRGNLSDPDDDHSIMNLIGRSMRNGISRFRTSLGGPASTTLLESGYESSAALRASFSEPRASGRIVLDDESARDSFL